MALESWTACHACRTDCPNCSRRAGNVFIVEGEKDVETIRAQGLTATCNPGGAGKWREEFGQCLRERVCILIPDNDAPGRKHVEDVGRKLEPYASESDLAWARCPDSPERGDVTDWLAAGHTAAELLTLVDAVERNASEPRASARRNRTGRRRSTKRRITVRPANS